MDLSLDDIIKQQNKKAGPQRQRGRSNTVDGRNNTSVRKNNPLQNSNGRIKKPTQQPQNVIIDARMKIIQKNRMRIGDAREKLNSIAKLSDARTKIRGRNFKAAANQRRDRAEVGPRTNRRSNGNVPPTTVLQRSIRNNMARNRTTDFRAPADNLFRCTVNRPIIDYSEPSDYLMTEMSMPLPARTRNDLSNIKIVAQNDYLPYHQEYLPQNESTYMDYEQPEFDRPYGSSSVHRGPLTLGRSGARMSQEMRARLDSPAKPTSMFSWTQSSHAAVVSPPPLPAPSPGYRIVVSNLHSTVTHEDIKELFDDIGPLLESRLVRPGTAEVIYKMQKDAKKAVEAYHNRQLDGQPMKCLLVNARSPSTSGSSGVLRSNNLPAAPKFPSSSKSNVVPDLSAIHKALFMNK